MWRPRDDVDDTLSVSLRDSEVININLRRRRNCPHTLKIVQPTISHPPKYLHQNSYSLHSSWTGSQAADEKSIHSDASVRVLLYQAKAEYWRKLWMGDVRARRTY